ncbi:MAG: response regulator, partial [Lentisphaeraceae bacterium]|nr:response regulator [Lentisphaeraceae bacterium]
SRTQPGVSSALAKTIDYLEQANALMIGLLKLNDNQEAEVPVVMRLDHLVKDFEMLIKHICSAAIKVEIDIESGLNTIKAERSDIQEILLNLCVNAKNAMLDKGDLLLISLKNVQKNNDKHVCLSVTDNGIGMSDEVVSKIFDAYFTTSGSGTGLGLWMVHRKVSELNGSVEVKSKVGIGTTFNVYFPVTANTKKIKTATIEKESLNKPEKTFFEGEKTILFIEDEPLIHSSVSKWLESMGLNVLAAEDGNTAYQLFCDNEQKLDLILQDYILPGLKGEELLSRFAASERDIPIIVMSAFSGEIDNSGIIEKGASAYLPKPFKINQLVELLSEYIN